MTMSRQHFQMIADVLANTPRVEAASREVLAEAFADALAATNERFDRKRFLAACMKNG